MATSNAARMVTSLTISASKWYGRYSRKVGFLTTKTAFHSFRHSFKDALQPAEVQEYISKALIGHVDKSVHAQYGSGPTLKALKEAIDKVEYAADLNMTKEGGNPGRLTGNAS